MIGGGYGDSKWLAEQFAIAGNRPVGCRFITWSLDKQLHVLDQALSQHPKAILLSFDDPLPIATRIKSSGTPLICQIQTPEANVGPRMHNAALSATDDDTIRSRVMDLARKLDWPPRYTARVLRNAFTDRWHGCESELMAVTDERMHWRILES